VSTSSPFVPDAVVPRYRGARATIDPDRSRSWLGRARPIVLAHKAMFVTSLACTATALLLQTAMPRVVMAGIDRALVARQASLTPFVVALVILALTRAAVSFVSRYFLYRVAFEIEYDLRTIVYEQLTRLSFSFYDRVQSGQLISRANSDIRSVQMYLTFAPSILVQCLSAVGGHHDREAVRFQYRAVLDRPVAVGFREKDRPAHARHLHSRPAQGRRWAHHS